MTSFLFIIKVPVEESKHKSKETDKQGNKEVQTNDLKKDEVQIDDLKKEEVQTDDLKKDEVQTNDQKKDEVSIQKEETEDKKIEISDQKEDKITKDAIDKDETKNTNKTPDDKNESDTTEGGVVQQSSATTLDEWDFGEDDHETDTKTTDEVPIKKDENKPIDTDEVPNKKEENKLIDLDEKSPLLFEQAKGIFSAFKDMVTKKNDVVSSKEDSNGDAEEKSHLLAETLEKDVLDKKDSEPKIFEVEPVDEASEILPLLEGSEKSEESKDSPKKLFAVTAVEDPKPETESKEKEPIATENFYKSTDKKNAVSLPEIKSSLMLGIPENKSSVSLQEDKSTASLPSKESAASLENLPKKVQFMSQVSAPDEEHLHPFIEPTTILEDTEALLDNFGIENYVVSKTAGGKFYQILFIDEGGEQCEMILNKLVDQGIGKMDNTSVGIYPSSIFKGAVSDNNDDSDCDSEGNEQLTFWWQDKSQSVYFYLDW